MADEEEDLPEPSDELTRPERWIAERLTPYRVFYLKRGMNLLLILVFLWASWKLGNVLIEFEQLNDQLAEKGCSALRSAFDQDLVIQGEQFPSGNGSFNSSGNTSLPDFNFSKNYTRP